MKSTLEAQFRQVPQIVIDTQSLSAVKHGWRDAGEPPQEVLSELLGVSVSQISREMSGQKAIDVDKVAQYCLVLGVLIGSNHPSVRNRASVRIQKCLERMQSMEERMQTIEMAENIANEKRPLC